MDYVLLVRVSIQISIGSLFRHWIIPHIGNNIVDDRTKGLRQTRVGRPIRWIIVAIAYFREGVVSKNGRRIGDALAVCALRN